MYQIRLVTVLAIALALQQGTTWSFDNSAVGHPPAGFSMGKTGSGRAGRWVVRAVSDAPSAPNVLAQEDDDDTDSRFAIAVADSPSFADVRISVRCKPYAGRVDQACGIVWRYQDENNYYLARANALEDNVNFYYVQNGRRREVKGWRGKVATAAWHGLSADMRGDHVGVYFDSAKVIDVRDSRFSAAGKVGVWTKADSRTLFDDLTVTGPVSEAQGASCAATRTSLTPPQWTPSAVQQPSALRGPLRLVRDIPLPGPANRFDYQSVDPAAGRLYINHMNAGSVIVFDLDSSRIVKEIPGAERATGVWAVPQHHMVYVSAAGRHELLAIDDRSLAVVARVGNVKFPDGIAYAPVEHKVFVSDESGEADVVIDARTNRRRSTIALGGEAGNTHYDSVSHCILVAVQTRNQLVAIDPATERVVARYDLTVAHPHGFTLDEPGRLAFITGEGDGKLTVVDLRTMRVLSTHRVGDDPDVLAWDASWRRLYVAAESGVLSTFLVEGNRLRQLEDIRAPHAHTVSVDPRTHHVYLPLENVASRPVLRVLEPTP